MITLIRLHLDPQTNYILASFLNNHRKWFSRRNQIIKNNLFTKSNPLTPSELYCINVVKKFDYENFIATLFINGNDLRRTAFALRAFNVELAQVRDVTKTDHLIQIRFQFWNDVIDEIYSKRTNNSHLITKYKNFPLASELYYVLSGCELSKHWLLKLINIRRDSRYLSEFPFQTLDELEKYSEASIVSLYYLLNQKSIQLSNYETNAGYRITLDHLANHLGKAQGLTNILRGIVHNAKNRRCYIPNDILAQTRCSHENFLQCRQDENSVREAVFMIASRANGHLEHSIKLMKKRLDDNESKSIRKHDRLLFLPIIPIQSYLNDLQKYQFNVFDSRLFQRKGLIPWKLWWESKMI